MIDGTGALHAVWCSKNPAYPNSTNIRYSKSTDGGTTWATPTQIITLNTSGWYAQNPCIVVNSNNVPTIVWETQQGTSINSIMAATWNGTAWNTVTVYAGGSYGQSHPVSLIGASNSIHVFWEGASATENYILQDCTSTDGGTTWSTPDIINAQTTVGIFYPSAGYDSSANKFYVICGFGGSPNNVTIYSGNAGSWTNLSSVSVTTASSANPQMLWSEFNENSSDAIRYIYNNGSAIDYDSITLNSPPNAPTLTTHSNFDATVAQSLGWAFSDPNTGDTQSAYQLQIVDTGNNTTVIDTGKVASTTSAYSLTANALTNGHNYQWRVTTWDQSNAQGPYSSYSTFSCAATPTVTVTTPANNASVAQSSLTVQFSYSDPASLAQQSYQVQLLDSADSTVLNDSGTINGTNNQYTIPYTLANNTTYHVKVRATNSQGITSAWTDNTFSTSFTPAQSPSITVTPLSNQGKITIAMTNYASTNLVENSGSEVVTTTATLFSDALTAGTTADPAWTVQSGSFTWSTSGATSGASGSYLQAGNPAWKPLIGSDGSTNLSLVAQATYTEPSSGYAWMGLDLYQDGNNGYTFQSYFGGWQLYRRKGSSTWTQIASGSCTISASGVYTAQLTLDAHGVITCKVFSGVGVGGTVLINFTYTDANPVTGGFLIGVGGDTGVVISNTSVTGPWTNGWTIGGDSRVAWGLTQSAIGGKYSLSAVGVGAKAWINSPSVSGTNASASTSYTASVYSNGSNVSSSGWTLGTAYGNSGTWIATDESSANMGTYSTTRITSTTISPSNANQANISLIMYGTGTVIFDNIQLEQSSTATPYIENDSANGSQSAPAIAYNDVYRRNTGSTTWTRIATNIANDGTYDDYATASGQSYDYKVTAVGNNQTSADSTVSSSSIAFRGLMVHQVINPSGLLNLLYQTQPKNDQWQPASAVMKYAGRTNDVVQFGQNETYTLSGPQTVLMDSDNQWDALNAMCRAKTTLCVRDGRGRKIFATVLDLKTTDIEFGRQVDLEFTQVDFSEAV